MRKLYNYLKDVTVIFLGMCALMSVLVGLMLVMDWSLDPLKGERFWNENTKAFIRLMGVMAILIAFIMRVRISIKFK